MQHSAASTLPHHLLHDGMCVSASDGGNKLCMPIVMRLDCIAYASMCTFKTALSGNDRKRCHPVPYMTGYALVN